MFGLFAPRCPLDAREKTWVELRMQWLVERLGFETLRTVEVVTPTDRYFPHEYHGTDEDIERIFVQVCRHIGYPREMVQLELFDKTEPPPHFSERHPSPLGIYQAHSESNGKPTVWIECTQANDPMKLIATVAHSWRTAFSWERNCSKAMNRIMNSLRT